MHGHREISSLKYWAFPDRHRWCYNRDNSIQGMRSPYRVFTALRPSGGRRLLAQPYMVSLGRSIINGTNSTRPAVIFNAPYKPVGSAVTATLRFTTTSCSPACTRWMETGTQQHEKWKWQMILRGPFRLP